MRRTVAVVAVVLGLLAAGCGDDDPDGTMLVLPSTVGTAVVDAATGDLQALLTGSAATPDGDVLFETRFDGLAGTTTVTARPTATLGLHWTTDIEGQYEARVADARGEAVVLGPSRAGVALRWGELAPGRTMTPLVVVRGDRGDDVQTLLVPGNVEPEAFSLDGDSLFVVNYLPVEAPTYYQVRQLDLATGTLSDVSSVDPELQDTMRGTARTQTWDPEGDRLYTLYTLDGGGAFVHVLDLGEEWAHCVDMPAGIGATSAGLALSDDGRTLYVADGGGGGIAEVDTEELGVTQEGRLPERAPGTASPELVDAPGADADLPPGVVPNPPEPAPTAVAIDGRRLLVGHGSTVDVLDRGSFEAVDRWSVEETLVGLQVEGDDLYVAHRNAVSVVDTDAGEVERTTPIRLSGGAILTLGGVPTYAGIQCAC